MIPITLTSHQYFSLDIGGLGKTILVQHAQHVYNDSKIDDTKFDTKVWVRVSDIFMSNNQVLTVSRKHM